MTNKEWLDYLAHNAPDELAAWFDSEHVENQERALDGDTDALEAKQAICTVTVDYDDLRDKLFEELQRDYIIMTSEEYGELTAERDELQAQVDTLKELNEYHALQYELASEDADRLQAQVDTLKSRHCPHYDATEHTCDVHETRIAELTAERERYRSKFGKCLDYADAIHALMDDEGMA